MKRFSIIVFLKVDNKVGEKVNGESIAPGTVASTDVVATIIVSNCGNSRVVLCCVKEPMPLSVDYKPNLDDEYARIKIEDSRLERDFKLSLWVEKVRTEASIRRMRSGNVDEKGRRGKVWL
ncbi:hypothetical protein RYX36_031939 [Vicia faba]